MRREWAVFCFGCLWGAGMIFGPKKSRPINDTMSGVLDPIQDKEIEDYALYKLFGEDMIPDKLYVFQRNNLYGCYAEQGVHGIAVFSTEQSAYAMREWLDMQLVSTTFDEIRSVAQSRPFPIAALILLDDQAKPVIHFVK